MPVLIEEFVRSPDYLNLGVDLSDYQYDLVKVSTQIYTKEDLIKIYGKETGLKRWSQTFKEVVFELGKGAGKDFTSTVAVSYLVYLLLCLKDPANYFGKPPGDNIDIINIAINAQQANNVFFAGFKKRIERSPWFQGKYDLKAGIINFDKNINVYSGHSEREAWEGYNVICVILDEIAGFALESTSGNEQAKTAEAIYKMYKASVTSRFSDVGKVILLSFPRFKDDFIEQRYKAGVYGRDNTGIVETVIKEHVFKIDNELPDGTPGNEFKIEWEEDHIIKYGSPGIYCLKRTSWDVNPTMNIEDYKEAFLSDPIDALSRYACMPPESSNAFFKSREKIETAFVGSNGQDDDGVFYPDFQPLENVRYYVHVDLARKQDHCAVAMAHVDSWTIRNENTEAQKIVPNVVVDTVRYWTPTKTREVDFTSVREYILSLQNRGFNLSLVTFDRWESTDISNELRKYGLRVEKLSVAKKHYTDMAMVLHEERVKGPSINLLIEELLQLRLTTTDKIDHPRKGSKDLSDAVCGAIFNAVAHTPRQTEELKIVSLSDFTRIEAKKEALDDYVIKAPPGSRPPKELVDYMKSIRMV